MYKLLFHILFFNPKFRVSIIKTQNYYLIFFNEMKAQEFTNVIEFLYKCK